jgi:hypothetical protein
MTHLHLPFGGTDAAGRLYAPRVWRFRWIRVARGSGSPSAERRSPAGATRRHRAGAGFATAEAALHGMRFAGGVLNTRLLGGEAVSPGTNAYAIDGGPQASL